MKIQINTDHNIEGHQDLADQMKASLSKALSHFSDHITRLEVHLSDENGPKSGQRDMRCMLEARLEGRQPTAVTCEAATLTQAVAGAVDKLKSSLQTTVGQSQEHR